MIRNVCWGLTGALIAQGHIGFGFALSGIFTVFDYYAKKHTPQAQ